MFGDTKNEFILLLKLIELNYYFFKNRPITANFSIYKSNKIGYAL